MSSDIFNETIINLKEEKIKALEYYKDYILNGRQIVLSATLFWADEKLFRIQAPNFESEQEFYKQLGSIMLLPNTITPTNFLFTFGYTVEYGDNVLRDSIVTIVANDLGFVAEPFPFDIVDDTVNFDDQITLSDKQCYSPAMNEIIAMGMKLTSRIDTPSNVLLFLAEKGFDIQFFNNYSIETIDQTSLGIKF